MHKGNTYDGLGFDRMMGIHDVSTISIQHSYDRQALIESLDFFLFYDNPG